MNIHQWSNTIKTFNKKFEENRDVQDQWDVNTRENLPLFNKGNSIWNLEDLYSGEKEKAMILVGSSPTLEKDAPKLRNLNDNFIIICANSALKYLLKNGVKPHYVICLDSDDIDIPQHLDCDSRGITLLSSTVVSKIALDAWQGDIYFMPYYSINNDLKKKIRGKLGKKIPSGGNSITSALAVVSIIFGSKIVIFVANEYCFDKAYYADKDSAKQEKLSTLYPAIDVNGNKRWTLPALYMYAIWTDKICNDLTPPGLFIDTSFGLLGKDNNAIWNKSIPEAIYTINQVFEGRKDGEQIASLGVVRHDKSEVLRYNLQTQREKLLQLARS